MFLNFTTWLQATISEVLLEKLRYAVHRKKSSSETAIEFVLLSGESL